MANQPTRIPIGNSLGGNTTPDIVIHARKWARILVVGESRSGKSALAKDFAVRLSKTGRKIVIFSHKGEWEKHVTKYGWFDNKMKMDGVKTIKDFKIRLNDLLGAPDFVSFFGNSDKVYQVLDILFKEGKDYHQYDIERFKELIDFFPTSQYKTVGSGQNKQVKDLVAIYEKEFGINLGTSIHFNVAQSLRTSFRYMEQFFAKEDENYVDFAKEFRQNEHLIINIGEDTQTARFLCGVILRKIRRSSFGKHPFFVFEELSLLLPPFNEEFGPLPSSVQEIHSLLTTGSKEGVGFLGVVQHESQIYHRSLEHVFTKIFVGAYTHGSGWPYDKARWLAWNPHALGGFGYREALIVNKDKTWSKLEPFQCCCRC